VTIVSRWAAGAVLLMLFGCADGIVNGGASPEFEWTHLDSAGAWGRPHGDADIAVFSTLFARRVVALDASTGALRWTRTLPALAPGRDLPGGNILAHADLILVPAWDLFALDRTTGLVRWRFGPEEEFPATDALVISDGTVYSPGATRVYAVRASDGVLLWSTDVGERPFAPVVDDGFVYVGTREVIPGTDALGAGHVAALDAADGRILWRTHIPGPQGHPTQGGAHRGVTPAGELLLVASRNGHLYALDRSDGQIRWEHAGDAAYESGVAVLDGTAVVANLQGWVEGFRVETGERIWRVNLDGTSIITPLVADGGCIFISVGTLLCIGPDGTIQWERGGAIRGGPSFSTSPMLAEGRLFVGSTTGFHALRMPR
jgi:outer membrane protein assembly factor BamB